MAAARNDGDGGDDMGVEILAEARDYEDGGRGTR